MVSSALQNIKDPERRALSCKATRPGLMPECSTPISGTWLLWGQGAAKIL